jgi:hypothetical protein
VHEIVRRQLQRPFARPAAREEEVIRERFSTYFGLPARKVETMRPIEAVVAELFTAMAAQQVSGRAFDALIEPSELKSGNSETS